MSSVIIIDAKNFVYRHAHTHAMLRNSDSFPTSVLFGCPSGMLSLTKKYPGAAIVFVWDGEGPTWRHHLLSRGEAPKTPNKVKDAVRIVGDLPPYMRTSINFIQQSASLAVGKPQPSKPAYPAKKERPVGYKAHRHLTPNSNFEDATKQIPLLRELLSKIGIRQFKIANLEGDDLIGILVTSIIENDIFDEVIIHSSDRDFYQFIDDRVHVLRSGKEGGFAKKEDIREEFGVDCADYTRLRAIIGDSSDNIPHLFRGVGSKTAAKWINAGLNPALERWELNPATIRQDWGWDKYDMKARWSEVHRNYKACQIVRDYKSELLPRMVRDELESFMPKMSCGYLCADTRKRTDGNWQWLTEFLIKYDLADLYSRRRELWALP